MVHYSGRTERVWNKRTHNYEDIRDCKREDVEKRLREGEISVPIGHANVLLPIKKNSKG